MAFTMDRQKSGLVVGGWSGRLASGVTPSIKSEAGSCSEFLPWSSSRVDCVKREVLDELLNIVQLSSWVVVVGVELRVLQ